MAQIVLKEDVDLLTKVFRVRLGATVSTATSHADGPDQFVNLDDLASELANEASGSSDPLARWADISARRSLFDRALFGRLSISNSPAVDFLIASYQRASDHRKRQPRELNRDTEEVYAYVLELCVSYTGIALLNASMFPQPAAVIEEGVLRLLGPLRYEGTDKALPAGFLGKLAARMEEDSTVSDFALPLFRKLAADVRAMPRTLLDDGLVPSYRAALALLRERPIAAQLAAEPEWIAGRNGHDLEMNSLLAPFFGTSCFPSIAPQTPQTGQQTSIHQLCFQSMTSIDSDFRSLRMALQLVQDALKAISTELLKNPAAKEPFFKLVASACSLNQARTQMGFSQLEISRIMHTLVPQAGEPPQIPQLSSSDGFLANLCAVLLQLCDPFTAPNSPHAAKIDATFLLSTHRLQLEKETRLCATTDDFMYWLDPRNPDLRRRYLERMESERVEPEPEGTPPLAVSTSFGTISEYFFLTMRLLHIGVQPSFVILGELAKQHHQTKQEMEITEEQMRVRTLSGASQAELQMFEAQLEKTKEFVEMIKRYMLCYQAQLLSPQLLSMILRYYRLVARWLVKTAEPPPEGLPLSPVVPRLFAALPEFCMEDIAHFFKNLTNYAPNVLEEVAIEELHDFLTLMVTFIGSPKYVKNPYLRATFTKLLRYLVPRNETDDEQQHGSHGSQRLAAVFHTHTLAKRFLPQALMQFFVDIEFTGSHTQAYDKYEYRLEMSQILAYFWTVPEYQNAMISFTRDTSHFVRFVNMLINDSIYTMDEALSKLERIHDTEIQMADEATWNRQDRRTMRQALGQHQQDENTARWYLLFTTEVLDMMAYLSAHPEVALVFMLPELVERIASMLNNFLVKLVSDKSKNLKVKQPDKYHFYPIRLLLKTATIMVHFSRHYEFGQAIVRDERSYDEKNMRKAIRVLSQKMVMPTETLMQFEAFCSRCAELKLEEAETEAQLGEVPDEFLCEITCDIMEDPVKLPSGKICDRKNICRHLLSDETDPFSRQRLTIDMLESDSELKARIEAFRRSKTKGGSSSDTQPMEVG
mmetsp:Transcript_32953/g.54448  ORF Transcript_32953/g.54448 Transcript_32953/m.54448 type:complete len:1043 (-) Transcript_32953:431-3559(-)